MKKFRIYCIAAAFLLFNLGNEATSTTANPRGEPVPPPEVIRFLMQQRDGLDEIADTLFDDLVGSDWLHDSIPRDSKDRFAAFQSSLITIQPLLDEACKSLLELTEQNS